MKLALLSSLLIASVYVNAQPVMVRDINPLSGSNPAWLTEYGNKLLFFANDGVDGNELFAYDTAASIQYDLNPGLADGGMTTDYKRMAVIGNDVYFPGDDGNTGIELYKWDGKTAPVLTADIAAGTTGSDIEEVIVFNGKVYFNANNGINGSELWSYDPGTGLSQRLTDLAAGSSSSNPRNFVIYKNKLYFTAFGNGFGSEVFAYDPATNTTTNAIDVATGTAGSNPQALTVINDKLYFSAVTTSYGRELYNYDGKNFARLTNVDNSSLDGVVAVSPSQRAIISYKNMVLFAGDDGLSGAQLYQYNPANGVTSMVFTINPSGASTPANFTNYGGKVYFTADNGSQGNELWMYNGKDEPMIVADLEAGPLGSMPLNLTTVKTNLFFSADVSASGGRELYKMLDSAALGVQNIRFNANVTVYPNPATDVAHISMNLQNAEAFSISLTDVTGKVIYNSGVQQYAAGSHFTDIQMSGLAQGMYIYTLRNNAGVMLLSGRIAKQ